MKIYGRFSVIPKDIGYSKFHDHGGHDSKWTVTLNGEEQRMVVAADTWERWVLVNLPDEHGRAYLSGPGEIAQEKRTGEVEVYVDVATMTGSAI